MNTIDRWLTVQAPGVSASTLATYATSLRLFALWLDSKGLPPSKVTIETLSAWMLEQRNRGIGGGRIRFNLAIVRRWHQWLVDSSEPGFKPLKGKLSSIRAQKPEKFAFTREQYEQVLRVLDHADFDWSPFWKAAVKIAWSTGLRCSDVAGLQWVSLDSNRMTLTVWPLKKRLAGERLEIPVNDELVLMLNAVPGHMVQIEEYILPAMHDLYERNRQALPNEFRKICDAAGLPKHSFHSLRRGFITRLLEAGVDAILVASMTGQTLDVLKGYAKIGNEAKLRALEKANQKEEM